MSLFDGEIAQLIGGVFNSGGVQQFTAATRIRITTTYTDGGDSQNASAETPCLAIVSAMSETQRKLLGFTDLDQQIIVLGISLNPVFATQADLTTDDQIVVNEGPFAGIVWALSNISIDPAGATITAKGTRG